jgi:DNA-binding beta-propeller fold protein YncE
MRPFQTATLCVLACGWSCSGKSEPAAAGSAATSQPPTPLIRSSRISTIALPGGDGSAVSMDYLLYDDHTKTVWVPAGNTGSVDVVDTATKQVHRIDGFPTKEFERNGQKRIAGPSSAAEGDGVVYIGDRADQSVCAVSEQTLQRGTCGTLDSSPDGILYVPTTKEVWVTTPRDKSVRVLDGATLAQKARIAFSGQPEGFAVDPQRGRFYTNMEDLDETHAVDVTSHAEVSVWKTDCGKGGPHGLRIDGKAGLLFVACPTKVKAINLDSGQVVGTADTGAGVDDLDYAPATHLLYAGGAGAPGSLTTVTVDPTGKLAVADALPTAPGARNGVVDGSGVVYLSHSAGGELLAVAPAPH